jgi:chorismate mutase/prephenate dehydratase
LAQYPQWHQHAVLNTAAAAQLVAGSGEKSKAAICSRRAAQLHGLIVLREKINTSADNFTRFFIVSREMEIRPGSDKISLMFTLPHEAGSLSSVLAILAVHRLNMLRLESRPMSGKGWEYRFFVDVEGSLLDEELSSAFYEIVENTLTLGILGNYPKGA